MGGERWLGQVVRFDDARGFGFVLLDDAPRARKMLGRTEVFVHWRAFPDRRHRPQLGSRVSLGLVRDHRGGWQGHNVEFLAPQTGQPQAATAPDATSRRRKAVGSFTKPAGQKALPGRTRDRALAGQAMSRRKPPLPLPAWFWGAEAAALLLWGMVMWQRHLPQWLVPGFAGLSALTFLAYAIDKTRASRGLWRIPENQLHLLSLAGGWPGALAAQQLLRHKNAKTEFQSVFWASVAGHVSGVLWLWWHAGGLAVS